MEYSDVIRKIRVKLKISQEMLAKELNVSFATINRWERNKSKPGYEAMRKIDEFIKQNNLEVY